MIECRGCGKQFESKYKYKNLKYCSHECYLKSQRKKISCPICGKKIIVVKSCNYATACSLECKSKYRSKLSKKYGYKEKEKNINWIGGEVIDKYGYKLITQKGHHRSKQSRYVKEHIVIMEEFLKRKILKSEQIHHINYNKLDNRMENLYLCKDNSTHQKIHQSILKLTEQLLKKNIIWFDKENKIYKLI